jgi:hypothetical protein
MSFSPRLYKFVPWMVRALIPGGYIGTYVLYSCVDGLIVPVYIGRSDRDLQRRLVNHPYLYKVDFFEYYTFDTAEKSFLSEAALYHCFKEELFNFIHPASPAFSNLNCPFCSHTYRETISTRFIVESC